MDEWSERKTDQRDVDPHSQWQMTRFLVDRSDISMTHHQTAHTSLQEGECLLRVDRFGLSTNNISYALYGDRLKYWDFFPVPGNWGVIPVWGFATVQESRSRHLSVGESLYGYLPMASHVIIRPSEMADGVVFDRSPHRDALPEGYNRYTVNRLNSQYAKPLEDAYMNLYPLFTTAFLAADYFAENKAFGASQIILSSASSKTALATAFCLSDTTDDRPKLIGVTSKKNVSFVRAFGRYDQVISYEEIESLGRETPSCYIDLAGSGAFLRQVHEQFQDKLAYSCSIGSTHWEERAAQHGLLGPKPVFFFAPEHLQRKRTALGDSAYDALETESWNQFVSDAAKWMTFKPVKSPDDLDTVYHQLLKGETPTDIGFSVQLADRAEL